MTFAYALIVLGLVWAAYVKGYNVGQKHLAEHVMKEYPQVAYWVKAKDRRRRG